MATPNQPIFTAFAPGAGRLWASVSMGAKLLVLTLLTLVLSLVAIAIDNLVDERTGRQADVAKQISAGVGGAQTLLGPTILIPYSVPSGDPKVPPLQSFFLVSATDAHAAVKTRAEDHCFVCLSSMPTRRCTRPLT